MVGTVTPPALAKSLGLLAMALASALCADAALWVSPEGDDTNPGTEERPLRTVERARDVVRTQNRDMSDDITVFIAGEHRLDRPIEFGPEDSGTNGYNVVYTAAPGEHPVLSGGYHLAGWTLADKERNLWSAPAPDGLLATLNLYVNGTPANRTHGRLLQAFSKSAAILPAAPADPRAHWKNPGDVLFVPQAPGAIWSERSAAAPLFVENAFELLGMPGEWYFDRPARRIYYTPRVGEEMTTADVVAASSGALVIGRGTRDRPLTGIILKGIGFEYTAVSSASDASPEGSRPGSDPAAAVSFAFAGGVQLLEDEFLRMSTPALDLGPAVQGGAVDGCVFGEISSYALRVTASAQVRVAGSRFSYVAMERVDRGAIELDRSEDVSVEGNQFDHFPSRAILSGKGLDSVRLQSNAVSQPMIGFHGAGTPAAANEGAGIPPAYRYLLDRRFSALTTPRPPNHVSAEAEEGFCYVTWIPSCQDGGAPVLYYTVAASTGATLVVTSADFQARGFVVFGGLEDGHGVTFAVSAANRIGSSPPSPPTANVTPAHKKRLKPPQAPAQVSATKGGDGIGLRILPPAADGGSPVVAYVVTPLPAGGPIVIEGLDVIHCDPSHPVSRVLAGLSQDPAPTVAVAARSAAGDSPPVVVRIPR